MKVLSLIVIGGVAYLVKSQEPEIRRYMKIDSM